MQALFLLLTILSFWADDSAYVVNEENCKFGHMLELPDDYRRNQLIKACYTNMEGGQKPIGGVRLQEKTVRPLRELISIPAEL